MDKNTGKLTHFSKVVNLGNDDQHTWGGIFNEHGDHTSLLLTWRSNLGVGVSTLTYVLHVKTPNKTTKTGNKSAFKH